MSLLEKHTGKFLVLIAGIIIFAHAVVPHHHHFDSVESHSESSECKTSKSEKHGENHETHCHALNIVVSEKSGDVDVKLPLVTQLHFDLFRSESKSDIALNVDEVIGIIYFCFSPPKQIFLTNYSLRAPPFAV